jgi:putative DNA-invertase from lambdoid prophage Rac
MKVAIYARVSTDEQTEQNQVLILEKWACDRGWEIIDRYCDVGSAWQKSDQKELHRLLEDARRGKFEVVIVWALDRLSRGGIGKMFTVLDTLQRYKVHVISNQESWTDVPNEIQPLLFSIFAWIAEQESKRISERTKIGMERARLQGKHIGRPKRI